MQVRSVRFGNLIIKAHALEQYASRIGWTGNLQIRDDRIKLARYIIARVQSGVQSGKLSIDVENQVGYVLGGQAQTTVITCYPIPEARLRRIIQRL